MKKLSIIILILLLHSCPVLGQPPHPDSFSEASRGVNTSRRKLFDDDDYITSTDTTEEDIGMLIEKALDEVNLLTEEQESIKTKITPLKRKRPAQQMTKPERQDVTKAIDELEELKETPKKKTRRLLAQEVEGDLKRIVSPPSVYKSPTKITPTKEDALFIRSLPKATRSLLKRASMISSQYGSPRLRYINIPHLLGDKAGGLHFVPKENFKEYVIDPTYAAWGRGPIVNTETGVIAAIVQLPGRKAKYSTLFPQDLRYGELAKMLHAGTTILGQHGVRTIEQWKYTNDQGIEKTIHGVVREKPSDIFPESLFPVWKYTSTHEDARLLNLVNQKLKSYDGKPRNNPVQYFFNGTMLVDLGSTNPDDTEIQTGYMVEVPIADVDKAALQKPMSDSLAILETP